MSLSLREQLLAAGLVSKKQATQVEKQQSQQQHKEKKASGKQHPPPKKTYAQIAQEQKAARDKELNRKKEEKAARRARAVAINQLVEQNRIARVEDENPEFYNFVDGGKIYRIAIKDDTREKVVGGQLVVARYRGFFALVPKDAADKIRAIDSNAVLVFEPEAKTVDDNDPYKEFVVPDDLKW